MRFLTRKPDKVLLSLGDSETLGVWAKNLTNVRVISYDADGAQQADGRFNIGTTFGENKLALLPVGPANINAIPAGSWLSPNDQVTIDTDTSYYVVQAGLHLPDGTWNGYSDLRTFFVIPSTCRQHRVHFINPFGVPDSFSIWNNKKVDFAVAGVDYTRPLPADFGIVNESAARQQATGRVQVKSAISNITDADREWLARDFSISNSVRLEDEGQYIPVKVKGGTFPVADSADLLDSISFTLEYSQVDIGIRN